MKVILLKDVPKQGKKDQVINVSDGYANNYLIKNGLAIIANESNMRNLKKEEARRELNEKELIKELECVKERLEKETLEFKVKTGKEDKLFGSISTKQIYSLLEEKGYDIKKEAIIVDEAINVLGVHYIKVELHKKVIAKVMVKVIK